MYRRYDPNSGAASAYNVYQTEMGEFANYLKC
jgi:hypothetical protein